MENSPTKDLFNQIIVLLDTHDESIRDTLRDINTIESNLKTKYGSKSFLCTYNPINTTKLNQEVSSIDFKVYPKHEDLTLEDKIYRALCNQIKSIINSPDKTITATGSATELVKNLADRFLSTMDSPLTRTDSEILAFVKRQDSLITNFIDKDCKNKMLSCLINHIAEEKEKLNVLYTSTINSKAAARAESRIDSFHEEDLLIVHVEDPEERHEATSILVTQSSTDSHNLKNKPIKNKIKDTSDELMNSLHILNKEMQSKYTDLVIDQIGGLEKISKTVACDSKNAEIFNLVKAKYVDEQEKDNLLIKSLESVKDSTLQKDSNGDLKYNIESSQQKPILNSHLFNNLMMNISKLNTDGLEEINKSNLVKALDNALLGLEGDIRLKLFLKSQYTRSILSKLSLFDNLVTNSSEQ